MNEPNDGIQADPPRVRLPVPGESKRLDDSIVGPSAEDRSTAVIAHVGGFLAWILLPLILWQIKKDQSRFASEHAKEALNFQITLTIYYIVGCLIFPVVMVYEIVFIVLACMAAHRGESYRIPLNIRFVK